MSQRKSRTTLNHIARQVRNGVDATRAARRWLKELPSDPLYDLWISDLNSTERVLGRMIEDLNRHKELSLP